MVQKSDSIKLQISGLPDKPGVYQYYDKQDRLLYVGKAKNLKKRVSSYFVKNHDAGKTRLLVKKIDRIEYILVDTELDALLLENNLIKKYRPLFNIQLKDDKTYPWICIKKERFPRVFATRKVIKDGSKYFGPYASVKMMNTLLGLIRQIYFLRNCNYDLSETNISSGKYKECLEFHLGNCKAPCIGKHDESDYDQQIKDIEHIIKGNIGEVVKKLKSLMSKYANDFKFEEAQKIKEKVEILKKYQAKSAVVSPVIHNVDVATFVEDSKRGYVNFLRVQNGAIVQGQTLEVKKVLEENYDDILPFAVLEMRERYNSDANEILVEKIPKDKVPDFEYFVPQRGDKKHLLDLSKRNAKYYMLEKQRQEKAKNPEKHTERILETVKKDLRLNALPTHIECFDNSNFQGAFPVAACVVFKNAKPSKKDYRHFNIKTVEGPDDFASMEEVVERRYKRLMDEGDSLPQLIVIDGGKGQLSSAVKSLDKLGLRGEIAIIGIAKKLEEIYFPGDSLPLYLDKRSESLKLIQNLRNEAHRFGINHHRNKRSKSAYQSSLLEIEGIGEKTAEDLMKHFKSLKNIQNVPLDDLTKVIGKAKAQMVYDFLHL